MEKYFKISIVGSGNVAWQLSQALENAGHTIEEVYSRNFKNAEKLCLKLYQAKVKSDLDFRKGAPQLIIIAVSDKAIPTIVDDLIVSPETIVVHTSGTESIDVFDKLSSPSGVLYPIQTFSKERAVDFKNVPFSIEASDEKTRETLTIVAQSLSRKVHYNSTEQRRIIHLSCVFAANFVNHMFTISKGLLESNALSFDYVTPLIEEVVRKAFIIGPESAQTGPAVRKDYNTIEKHLNYLTEEEGLTAIYKSVTEDIIKTFEE